MRCPQPPQNANAAATGLPQCGQATLSTTGAENDACDGCAGDAIGMPAAGTAVIGRMPPTGLAAAFGRVGTCIGTEPIPICTEGTDAGIEVGGAK
jgi:hypothetical protein